MYLIACGLLFLLLSGIPGLFCSRNGRAGEFTSVAFILCGALLGVVGIFVPVGPAELSIPLPVPDAAISLARNPLSVVFLLPLYLVTATGAVFGLSYWPQKDHPHNACRFRLFYGLIAFAMAGVFLSDNAFGFLLFWELMAVSGYFLITTEDERADVRQAGLIYFVSTHAGTLALLAMFGLVARDTGSFAFPAEGTLAASVPVFVLGIFGFGLKAGLMPLHIWLPAAHASAPSHASALLSGIMIKTGIYGLVRLTSFFDHIPMSFGATVLVLGILSGVMGVAFAVAQHDIKRLLAYHSVENIGIIAMGLGLALLGRSVDMPLLVVLGSGGALLHVMNHGIFKPLLFYAAGAVIHGAGTRDIDLLGGIIHRAPRTALAFLVGAVAISGLPPLNGFVSEWFIYLAGFQSLLSGNRAMIAAALAIPALALIGALALACFVKVFGVVFLGAPRSPEAQNVHEASSSMQLAMAPLMLACAGIGLFPFAIAPLLDGALAAWLPGYQAPELLSVAPLYALSIAAGVTVVVIGMVALLLRLRRRTGDRQALTWGCGFSLPTPRMQYTSSSFADSIVGLFQASLRTRRTLSPLNGMYPAEGHFHSHTADTVLDGLLLPLFHLCADLFTRVRAFIQNGATTFYLLCIGLTAIILLVVVL